VANLYRKLRDWAVYWAPEKGSVSGQYVFEVPVEVKCHWEEMGVEFLDREGNRQLSRALVYVADPKLRLGVMWKGRLKDAEATTKLANSDPFLNEDAYEIRQVKNLPSTRSDARLVTLYL
jgi:hypothetical protein